LLLSLAPVLEWSVALVVKRVPAGSAAGAVVLQVFHVCTAAVPGDTVTKR
jgi:hypothetical protein